MNAGQIFDALKKKIYSPVYFFYGEEPFYIDELTAFIENNVLDEASKAFNQTIVYGLDVSARDVADLARRFPMMGDYQVVIVKEAQNIQQFDPLIEYFKNPLDTTILVINYKYKKLDKRKALYKLLNKSNKVVLFESQRVYDNKIPAWISERVHFLGYSITPKSEMMLAEFLGTDLSRIANEINKLTINLQPGEKITEDLIEKNIGISKEFNVFELQNALGRRDVFRALRIIEYFEANPKQNPLQMVNVLLYSFFMKILLYHQFRKFDKNTIAGKLGISPFFVSDYQKAAQQFSPEKIKQIIAELRIVDMKSKGMGATETKSYGPLKEWLFKALD
ncbi:DNA polymerase III subunit delta [Candidatus Sulfidibacterium hydrothermale]|uniref:DNA polymerase III subunit delta n=1 Tax=Candidatus Sulfidibacterium hydrothermale TaxID=2875962 RepID=UPI001F0A3B11|nr:DNA polymerase III subunit delta [Candidatus Sulfidibacterium hydrothermale]UBM62820.1 DNA polymerase III subunit delta [Candidatus Sulfidibacterium hydrothermale]